jgi:hypothetical protein
VIQKAQQAYDKAAKQEHKTSQELGEARHKHDLAVASENKAEQDLSVRVIEATNHLACISLWACSQMRRKHLQEAHQIVERRRDELEQAHRRKDARDVGF